MENNEYAGGPFIRFFPESNYCQEMLLKSYQVRGEQEQGKGTMPIVKSVTSFVMKGTLCVHSSNHFLIDYK